MPAVDALTDLLFPEGTPGPPCPPPAWPMPSDLREFLTRIGHTRVVVDGRVDFGAGRRFFEDSVHSRDLLREVLGVELLDIRCGEVDFTGVGRGGDEWSVAVDDLLFLGSDDRGNDLYLEAVGDPDDWAPVAAGHGCRWARYDMSVTDYLHGLLSGSLRCSVFAFGGRRGGRPGVAVLHD